MKKNFLFSILILSLQLPLCCFAKNGIYFTLTGGLANQSGLPSTSDIGALSKQTILLSAIRGGIGYNHDLCDLIGIGLDIGYGRYGKEIYFYPTNETIVHSESLEFFMLTQLHLCDWDIIGKLGGIRHTVSVSGQDSQADQTQIEPEVTLGLAYNINPTIAVMAEYAHVFGQRINHFSALRNKTPTLNEFLLGFRYSF